MREAIDEEKTMMIKPECRYCGAKVRHFGEVCADCIGTSTEEEMDASNESFSTLKKLGEVPS